MEDCEEIAAAACLLQWHEAPSISRSSSQQAHWIERQSSAVCCAVIRFIGTSQSAQLSVPAGLRALRPLQSCNLPMDPNSHQGTKKLCTFLYQSTLQSTARRTAAKAASAAFAVPVKASPQCLGEFHRSMKAKTSPSGSRQDAVVIFDDSHETVACCSVDEQHCSNKLSLQLLSLQAFWWSASNRRASNIHMAKKANSTHDV